MFYIYPTRLAKGAPGDFQNAGKQMIFMTLKMLMLGLSVAIVGLGSLPGAIGWQSPQIAVIGSAIVLCGECVVLIPLLTIAFNRFDVSIVQVG